MTRNHLQTISSVSATAAMLLLGSARSNGQEIDFECRCVILESPSFADQTTTLPESVAYVYVGDTFFVELWATDSGTTNTGLVSAYTDMVSSEDLVTCSSVGHAALFGLFPDGVCDGSSVDELGGSQLTGGVGVEPEWARVAYVEFTADAAGFAGFLLEPAQAESSAYNRGLVRSSAIAYGSCDVVSRERGACCAQDTCTDGMTEDECIASDGRYLCDGVACAADPDGDNFRGCDDICPTSFAPAGVDSKGRPLGDLDGDCDVDLKDFDIMEGNFTGPRR